MLPNPQTPDLRNEELPVRVYVNGAGEWRDLADWPPPEMARQPWYLAAGGSLVPEPPAQPGISSFRYDPADPTPSVGGQLLTGKAGAADNRALEARPDVLVFTSAPLTAALDVVGPVSARVRVRASGGHFDVFARLCDVDPRGRSRNVCDGIIRHRPGAPGGGGAGGHSGAREEPGSTAEPEAVTVPMSAAAYRFAAGHRLRLQVSGGAHPRFARNTGSGEPPATATRLVAVDLQILHDVTHPSVLSLPVLPGRSDPGGQGCDTGRSPHQPESRCPAPGGSTIPPRPLDRVGLPCAATRPASGPTALRIVLGSQLRRLREAHGITCEAAGEAIRASASKISRLEHGRVSMKQRDLADLLTLSGVTGEAERADVLRLAREAARPGWWHQYGEVLPGWFEFYVGLEAAASRIRIYEVQFVPGLLQTPEYARAVIRRGHLAAPEDEIARRVSLRMKRQQILSRPDGPKLWAVVDETALRRRLGGPGVMEAQLERLIELAGQPNIALYVVPLGQRLPWRRGRLVQHPAVRPAGSARRGLPGAAHRRAVPGQAAGRRSLRRGHGPVVRAGRPAAARPGDAGPDPGPAGLIPALPRAWPPGPGGQAASRGV